MGETVQSLVAQAGGGPGLGQLALFLLPMIAIMYFLMIRPERKRQAEQQSLLSALKKGDEVVLTSGIIGKIHAVEDKTLIVEIGDKMRIKVLKVAVSGPSARFLAAPADPKAAAAAAKDEKPSTPVRDEADKGSSDEKKSA